MTVFRVVVLACDKPGCDQKFVGGAGQEPHEVRADAGKLAGWSTQPPFADVCRWHS